MFCPKCGKELVDTASFCSRCGAMMRASASGAGPTTTSRRSSTRGLAIKSPSLGERSATLQSAVASAGAHIGKRLRKPGIAKLAAVVAIIALAAIFVHAMFGNVGGLTLHSASAAEHLIPVAEGYTAQEREDAGKAAQEFLDAVLKQDEAALERLCPADAACFELKSYQGYFDCISSDASDIVRESLRSPSNCKVDDVRIEGDQVNYGGAYRVRVSLCTYDLENAESNAGIADLGTRAWGLLELFGGKHDDNVVGNFVEGYNRGQQINEDAIENYSKMLAASLRAQGQPTRESYLYLIASRSQGGWAVAPVSNADVVNMFGGWSVAGLATVSNDGKVGASALQKPSDNRLDRYSETVPFAEGEQKRDETNSAEGIEISKVQIYRKQDTDGTSVYRMTADVANRTGSSKDVVLMPGITDSQGKDLEVGSGSRSFGVIDDAYLVANHYANVVPDNADESDDVEELRQFVVDHLWDYAEDVGMVLCVDLKPGESRAVDLHLRDVDDSEWGENPRFWLAAEIATDYKGPEGYIEGGATSLVEGDVEMTVNFVGYEFADPTSAGTLQELLVARGTIKNNTSHYINAIPSFVSYAENGAPLGESLDLPTYQDRGLTGWIAPGESGEFEVFANDDRWLIDRIGLQCVGYAYTDNANEAKVS